jgi:hypothetical protein
MNYVYWGYGFTFVGLGLYAFSIWWRGRRVGR